MCKHLQLHDLIVGEYVTDKYALWLYFKTIDENALHWMDRVIGSMGEESPCKSRRRRKWLEHSRCMSTSSWMPSWTFRMEHSFLPCTRKMLCMMEPHTALFMAPTGIGKTQLALDSLEREYLDHFNFIIILCPTVKHNEAYHQWM